MSRSPEAIEARKAAAAKTGKPPVAPV